MFVYALRHWKINKDLRHSLDTFRNILQEKNHYWHNSFTLLLFSYVLYKKSIRKHRKNHIVIHQVICSTSFCECVLACGPRIHFDVYISYSEITM